MTLPTSSANGARRAVLRTRRRALAGALLALSLAAPALAQPVPAPRSYSVAAGSLDEALNRFAAAAGILLTVDARLTAGKRSPGLEGSHSVEAGLARLLAGSGLEAVPAGNGGYRLQPARGGETTLAPVKVRDHLLGETTEGTRSYTLGTSATATRFAMSPRETPQTLTVVTRQAMEDFSLSSVDAVLNHTSGTYVYTRGSNGARYYSRGFDLQSQYDGVPNSIGIGEWNANPSPDSAVLDHVEILQGASGLLTGPGEPGGVVNLVRKLPTAQPRAAIEVGAGSWDRYRLAADVSAPITAGGGVRARAVAAMEQGDSFVDYEWDRRHTFYGVVEADLAEGSLLTASVQYQKNAGNTHYGVPMRPNGRDFDFGHEAFFGLSWGSVNKENLLYTLRLDQELWNEWALRATYQRSETDLDSISPWLGGTLNEATGDGLTMSFGQLQRKFTADTVDLYLTGPVQFFGRRHELVFGANGFEKSETFRTDRVAPPFNVYTYHPASIPRPDFDLGDWGDKEMIRQHGVYGAVRLSLADPLKLILGTRVTDYSDPYSEENGVVSPYAGVIYELNEQASAYLSYSDIFTPQTSRSLGGSTLKPVVGSNYEAGVKAEFAEGRLNAAFALFRLEQTNLAMIDEAVPFDENNSCLGYCYKASGLVISQGVDLSLNGELAPGWEVMAGYTFVQSEYGKGEDKGRGYMTDLPDNILRVSTTWAVPGTAWTVGGNLRVQSRIYNKGTGFRVQQGGLALAGLLAKYRLSEGAELSLAVENLFDREYYQTVGRPGYGNFYGAPRHFTVGYRQTF